MFGKIDHSVMIVPLKVPCLLEVEERPRSFCLSNGFIPFELPGAILSVGDIINLSRLFHLTDITTQPNKFTVPLMYTIYRSCLRKLS